MNLTVLSYNSYKWRVAAFCAVGALALLCVTFGSGGLHAELKLPKLTGQIVDQAGLLNADDRAQITRDLHALEKKTTDQIVIVTVKSLDGYPIEEFGYKLGRAWGIGQKDKNNGIILIVAPNERKVRIEVGRGLEGEMTDIMSKLIVENAILPRFRRGDFSGGIKMGVRDIKDVILGDAEAVKERARGGGRIERQAERDEMITLAIWVAIFAFMIWQSSGQARRGARGSRDASTGRRGRRRGDNGWVIIPGGSGGSGHWGGGGRGGFGGGFGGGGGGFGGGGASGSW